MPVNAYGEATLSPLATQQASGGGLDPQLLQFLLGGGMGQTPTGGGGGTPTTGGGGTPNFSLGFDQPSDFMSSLSALMRGGGTVWGARPTYMGNFDSSLGVGDLAGIANLGIGAFNGSPIGAAGGALSLAGTIARMAGYPMASAGLGAIGGPLSLAGSLYSGNYSGVPSGIVGTLGGAGNLLSTMAMSGATLADPAIAAALGIAPGALGTAGSAGAVGATTAAGAAGGLLSSIAGGLAIPAAVAGMILTNNMAKREAQKFAQAREHRDIVQRMSIAWPQHLSGARSLADAATALQDPNANASEILRKYADVANQGNAASAAISEFISTKGGKEGVAGIPGSDVSRYEAVTPELMMRNFIASMRFRDALANAGQPLSNQEAWAVNPTLDDPAGWIRGLYRYTGMPESLAYQQANAGNASALPSGFEQRFHPGDLEQSYRDLFTQYNPNFAQTPLAQLMASSPTFNLGLTPQQMLTNRTGVYNRAQDTWLTKYANQEINDTLSGGWRSYEAPSFAGAD